MPELLDHLGRPISTMALARKAQTALAPIDKLREYGVSTNPDGSLNVPPEALKAVREDQYRRATMSRVPSTPRFMFREIGGLAVRKGHSRFEVLSLEVLRRVRERSPMLQAIHQARHYQLRRMARKWPGKRGEVGWRIVHKDFHSHDAVQPKDMEPYIERATRMFTKPAERYGCKTTGDLFGSLWEDLATINRPTLELLRSAWYEEEIVGMRPVDGGIIWPSLVWLEKWFKDHPDWWSTHGRPAKVQNEVEALQLISEIEGFDIFGAEFCLVRDGALEAVYTSDQMICSPILNRTDISYAGYPPSHVEVAVETTLAFINTWDYNATMFTRGMLADFIIGVSGDVHEDDVDAFLDQLREATQGVSRAWQPPVMSLPHEGAIQKIDLKASPHDMAFETWMSLVMSLGCADYRMDTSTVNFKPWDGGSGPSLSAPNREKEISLAKEEGLQGDLGHLVESVFTPLVQRIHPDLVMVMEYGDYDPMKEAEVHEKQAEVSRTRNDIRVEQGDLPEGFWVEADKREKMSDEDREKYEANPWNWTNNATFGQAMQAIQQAKQMAEMGPMGPGGPPGPDEDLPERGQGAPEETREGPTRTAASPEGEGSLSARETPKRAESPEPTGTPQKTGPRGGKIVGTSPDGSPIYEKKTGMAKASPRRITVYVEEVE